MGFMGMGMQKWIHKQKPRKPFSKNRKPTFSAVDSVRQQEFAPHRKEKSRWYHINLTPILILLLIALISIPFIKTWKNYSNNVLQEEREKEASVEVIKQHNEVNRHQYLIRSAEVQLDYKNYDYLLNESIFLMEKYPNSIKAKQLHLLALYNLCKKSNPKHCNHYTRELEKYKQDYPGKIKFKLGEKIYSLAP